MCSTSAKGPMLETDDADFEDATSSSSSDAEEVDPATFELVRLARDDGASGFGAVDANPSEDARREKC